MKKIITIITTIITITSLSVCGDTEHVINSTSEDTVTNDVSIESSTSGEETLESSEPTETSTDTWDESSVPEEETSPTSEEPSEVIIPGDTEPQFAHMGTTYYVPGSLPFDYEFVTENKYVDAAIYQIETEFDYICPELIETVVDNHLNTVTYVILFDRKNVFNFLIDSDDVVYPLKSDLYNWAELHEDDLPESLQGFFYDPADEEWDMISNNSDNEILQYGSQNVTGVWGIDPFVEKVRQDNGYSTAKMTESLDYYFSYIYIITYDDTYTYKFVEDANGILYMKSLD